MNITDIRACAGFYQKNYLETFYLVVTYYSKSFILIGEKSNFPHLMGIQQNTYRSNGYNSPKILFRDILAGHPVSTRIIPARIAPNSKMYKKALHFQQSTALFWKNSGPLIVNFNPSLSSTKLSNVDVLLTDINTGYMLGWIANTQVPVNADISLKRYCICTWIDESGGAMQRKEKYLPGQDLELIRYVFAFDSNSKLIRHKEYTYSRDQKADILQICMRNRNNLLLDAVNKRYYLDIAASNRIHCRINGIQY